MGQALYRKYRSKSLDEIVGQEHITDTLQRALKQGRISHAYLLTGPRGVGKTSVARILAHAVNGLPYDDDNSHIDIIEIDAASNRRIDEIRELREKVYVAPTSAKYKVYIIDEVHMLTKEAFNALLKTLEEPPAHVIFILATTDAHKLPETIVSRTQRFAFKPVPADKVIVHLRHIADSEQLTVDDEALQLLAEHGEGSFRDSISLLDQATSHGQAVTADIVRELLGIPPQTALEALLAQVFTNQPLATVAQSLNQLYEQGYQAASIAKLLGQLIRHDLITDQRWPRAAALTLLQALLGVPTAHDPERYLEIVLLRQLRPAEAANQPVPPAKTVEPAATAKTDKPAPVEPAPSKPAAPKRPVADGNNSQLSADNWPVVLEALKRKHNTLYGVVRMAEPRFDDAGDELTLAFGFAFHQKRMNEVRNQQLLAATIEELTGQPVRLSSIVDKAVAPDTPVIAAPAVPEADGLTTISNIFGGAELLES